MQSVYARGYLDGKNTIFLRLYDSRESQTDEGITGLLHGTLDSNPLEGLENALEKRVCGDEKSDAVFYSSDDLLQLSGIEISRLSRQEVEIIRQGINWNFHLYNLKVKKKSKTPEELVA